MRRRCRPCTGQPRTQCSRPTNRSRFSLARAVGNLPFAHVMQDA
jgi:hypothetical protein